MSDQERRSTPSAADGAAVADNGQAKSSVRHGAMATAHLVDALARFRRERPPERAVNANGAGAFGTFRVTGDITAYTAASVFAHLGKETPVLARFSTATGERGAADAERDLRGFALRFYTDAGNWDLVGSNSPVFFVQDPTAFPAIMRAQRRDPRTNLHDPAAQWDLWSRRPESLHQVTMMMSDRGIPRSYRHMHGYGGHTYAFINGEGERVWVKFHLRTQQGVQTMTDDEAAHVVGRDPNSHTRDLYTALARGDHPKWTLYVQVMPATDVRRTWYDPFDITKVWPHADYPLLEVGEIELNRAPANHLAEIEQAAFQPKNLVPGIGMSPDRLLQARIIAYGEAQRDRLGVHHEDLPVNRPWSASHDGARSDGTTVDDAMNDGDALRRDDLGAADDTHQAGELFRRMSPEAQTRLINRIVASMADVSARIQRRQIAHFYRADPAYGAGIARGLGIDLADAAE